MSNLHHGVLGICGNRQCFIGGVMNKLTCAICDKEVEPEDCTFGGLHREAGCYGRVVGADGREFTGSLKPTKSWFYVPTKQEA